MEFASVEDLSDKTKILRAVRYGLQRRRFYEPGVTAGGVARAPARCPSAPAWAEIAELVDEALEQEWKPAAATTCEVGSRRGAALERARARLQQGLGDVAALQPEAVAREVGHIRIEEMGPI